MPFVKGHPGFKPKGAKSKTTLDKEMRRVIFDKEVSKVFIKQIKKARAEYLLDQFIGKAPDTVKLEGIKLFLGKKDAGV